MNDKYNIVRFQLPARLDALSALEKKVWEVMDGMPESDKVRTAHYNLTLALHELCANIINHAYEGQEGDIGIELTLELDHQLLQAIIIDSGKPFDRAAVSAPNFEVPQEHGYGIFLIEALVDEVTYTRLATGNQWALTLSSLSKNHR